MRLEQFLDASQDPGCLGLGLVPGTAASAQARDFPESTFHPLYLTCVEFGAVGCKHAHLARLLGAHGIDQKCAMVVFTLHPLAGVVRVARARETERRPKNEHS